MPVVSVIVASYNSSQFIIETLDSILLQTWNGLELIITDDCSNDDTVEVCSGWLSENKHRFTSANILTSEKNTGVTANANRGLSKSKGDWVKFLGADDTLKQNCIEINMGLIALHPEYKVLFSQIEVYRNTFEPDNLIKTTPALPILKEDIMDSKRSAESQYKMLLVADRINFSPSVFLHRETLLNVGGFDERFRMMEDYPLWLNLTRKGHKLYFMEKVTVNYRQHFKAINNTGIPYLVNPNYFKQEDFRMLYTYPYLPSDIRLNQHYNWFVLQLFRSNCLNRNKKPNRFLLSVLTTYLNPFKYYIYLRKKLKKNIKDWEFYI
jgi:glycosyltransferase involved in cell wall biosynthesis